MTKASDIMKRSTGVSKRRGSSVYQWGIKAPADLRGLYASQWAHRCSLDTMDMREAAERASRLQAEWLARFAEQRRALNPTRVETITADLGSAIAQRIRATILRADDSMRDFPEAALGLLARAGDTGAAAKLAAGPLGTPDKQGVAVGRGKVPAIRRVISGGEVHRRDRVGDRERV